MRSGWTPQLRWSQKLRLFFHRLLRSIAGLILMYHNVWLSVTSIVTTMYRGIVIVTLAVSRVVVAFCGAPVVVFCFKYSLLTGYYCCYFSLTSVTHHINITVVIYCFIYTIFGRQFHYRRPYSIINANTYFIYKLLICWIVVMD